MSTMPDRPRIDRILGAADQCVKCGLCLPACPTYGISRNEADGPRGRIALLQGLALGALEPDSRLTHHLDACLSCRACEAVCPAKVPFADLMNLGRDELQSRVGARPGAGWARLALSPRTLRLGAWLLYLAQRTGLRRLARRCGLLRLVGATRLDALAPELIEPPRALGDFHPARGARRGRVALFTGCIGGGFDQRTLRAAIRVLSTQGYDVSLPRQQGCCGALARHAGRGEEAQALRARNRAAFQADDADSVVFVASGCGAELAAEPHAPGYVDLMAFLAANWREQPLRPLAQTAAVHEPCTQRNVLGTQTAVYALLAKIPQLKLTPLPGNDRCCGAAGSQMLTDPAQADRLRAPKLRAVADLAPHYLLTSNIGCALHLAAGLRADGAAVAPMHPVELLAQQL